MTIEGGFKEGCMKISSEAGCPELHHHHSHIALSYQWFSQIRRSERVLTPQITISIDHLMTQVTFFI